MRIFIAIELSAEIREALAQVQHHLKYAGADVKWVEKENIHLTLKFLGEVADERLAELKLLLDEVSCKTRSFGIMLKGVGAFPNVDRPRVIWVGMGRGGSEAAELAGKLDEALAGIGFQKESRPFAAHFTIGRVRSPRNKAALKEKMMSIHDPKSDSQVVKQDVNSIVLFKSTLTPQGSIYTKLHEAMLG